MFVIAGMEKVPVFLFYVKGENKMIDDQFKTSPELEKAKQKEQEAKEKKDKALKALSDHKRKFENSRKYFIGGTVHKYCKDCFLFEDHEIDLVIKTAFESIDVKRILERIRTGANPTVARPVNVATTVDNSDD